VRMPGIGHVSHLSDLPGFEHIKDNFFPMSDGGIGCSHESSQVSL